MRIRHTSMLAIGLLSVAAMLGASRSSAPAPASPAASVLSAPAPHSTVLTWTQDVVSYYRGDWDGAVQTAADWTEGGFTDWRLPTPAELQAALQDGSWGQGSLNVTHRGWTSRSSGTWAYAVTISTDANGFPIPSQSGQLKKYLKGSNFAATKFVRP